MEKKVIQINGEMAKNVNVSLKKFMYVKNYVWNPATCICKNGKYLASIMDDSGIIFDEVIKSYCEQIKTIPTNVNELEKYNL